MKDITEYDIIKSVKFFLILGGILYIMLSIKTTLWPGIVLITIHVAVFISDLIHRILKGKWKYKPY